MRPLLALVPGEPAGIGPELVVHAAQRDWDADLVVFGDAGSLDDLRTMGKSGEAWPLVDGAGRVYGAFVITGLDETQRAIMDNGVARISDFTLSLKRVDDDLDDEGVAP